MPREAHLCYHDAGPGRRVRHAILLGHLRFHPRRLCCLHGRNLRLQLLLSGLRHLLRRRAATGREHVSCMHTLGMGQGAAATTRGTGGGAGAGCGGGVEGGWRGGGGVGGDAASRGPTQQAPTQQPSRRHLPGRRLLPRRRASALTHACHQSRVRGYSQRADVSATASAICLASRACASWTSPSLTCSRAVCLWYASFVASSSRSWICNRSVLFCSVNCLRTTRRRTPQGWDNGAGQGHLGTATLRVVPCQWG